MINMGVDISKSKGVAVVKDDAGRLLEEYSFRNDRDGICGLIGRLRGFNDGVRVVVESTGNLWLPLYEAMEKEGASLVGNLEFLCQESAS